MTTHAAKVQLERDWLVKLLTDPGRVDITDIGFNMVTNEGEIVYTVPYGRFEVTIKEVSEL